MATLTATALSRAGLDAASGGANMSSAAGGGDKFTNTGSQFALFINGSGSPITVTLVAQDTIDGVAVTNKTITVGASGQQLVGPFLPGAYNDGSGYMNFTYSGVSSLKVGIFSLAPNT